LGTNVFAAALPVDKTSAQQAAQPQEKKREETCVDTNEARSWHQTSHFSDTLLELLQTNRERAAAPACGGLMIFSST
jgi:hypothetical protein